MNRLYSTIILLTLASCAARGQVTSQPATLFDPGRHMRVSEVKAGMKGYGLSVFAGTRIERFEVEVISILHNFNPKYDVILIRCHGANLEHTGAIAGMSGSPIYLIDDQGRSRLCGAFAYGWPLMKDPLGGVQPIEYMLEVAATMKPEPAATQQANRLNPDGNVALCRYDPLSPAIGLSGIVPLTGNDATRLQPLATPLMTSGLSAKLIDQFGPTLRAYGLVPLQAGGASSGSTNEPSVELAPGSVLAAPLLTGDVSLIAIGTCTEVLGDRIFGFGHPFNNEGPITLPMGSGKINGIIPSLSQSFKLGAMTQLRGTLIADQSVGVAGKLGKSPPPIPIDVHVVYTDGSLDVKYHFDAAAHPRLTPVLSGLAITSALSGQRDLPQYHTVHYDLALQFANDQVVQIKNVAVNSATPILFSQLSGPVILAAENPFERVMLKKISGTVYVTPEAHEADILSVDLAKLKYRPGEMLKASVRYRPFRAGEKILPIELELPHDLKDGKYQLSVGDQETYIQEEQLTRPFRFTAESTDEVFAVLKDITSIRDDALYVRLLRQSDGVAIGRTAMPLLPSSRRQVLLDAGRSNVTSFVSAAVKIIPTEMVMHGSADFEIEIDTGTHAEPRTVRPSRPLPTPSQPPTRIEIPRMPSEDH